MLQLMPNQAASGWCVYTLTNEAGDIIFIWPNKISNALSLRDAMSNPHFDKTRPVKFSIIGFYDTQRDAQNAMGAWMRYNTMPPLNRTVRFSHYCMVQCDQTGQVYRNQTEAARMLGINQAQLSQHLRRASGYKTVKGLTFSLVTNAKTILQPQPTASMPPAIPTPCPPAVPFSPIQNGFGMPPTTQSYVPPAYTPTVPQAPNFLPPIHS